MGNNDGPWCCVLIASIWNLDVNKCLGFGLGWVGLGLEFNIGFRPPNKFQTLCRDRIQKEFLHFAPTKKKN